MTVRDVAESFTNIPTEVLIHCDYILRSIEIVRKEDL